jgi:hypothetical protein
MNTIDGLKAIPNVLNILLDERDAIQGQIDSCYKPFRDIIQEVMIDPYAKGLAPSLYVDDMDIGISEDFVCFCIRDHLGTYDDQVVGTYKYPIYAFVTATDLRTYIANEKELKKCLK